MLPTVAGIATGHFRTIVDWRLVGCAATWQPPRNGVWRGFRKRAATHHDRVAVTIETVISRDGLGMLRQQSEEFLT
jgi:hypothetical protein